MESRGFGRDMERRAELQLNKMLFSFDVGVELLLFYYCT